MRKLSLDSNIWTQIGLDSGSLTMWGAVVHNFLEPGEYRCVLHRGTETEVVFYIKADKSSPAAQLNIDLATLRETERKTAEYHPRFVVNPRGYVIFHVSGGSGHYFVHCEKAEDNPQQKPFNSRELKEGDIFSATIIRPGTYSVTNLLTKARGEIVVSYPKIGKTPYRPPNPIMVECTRESIKPERVELQPGQGMLYNFKAPSRIRIELLKADDGPPRHRGTVRAGWRKPQAITKGQAVKEPKRR